MREHPYYFLLKARVHTELGEIEEAIKTLESALSLPGVRTKLSTTSSNKRSANKESKDTPIALRVSVFIQLASLYVQRSQMLDASNLMQDGEREFQNTPEHPRFHLANAHIALARGEPVLALNLLQNIRPSHSCYLDAQLLLAQIHLTHRNDHKMFIQCYKRMADLHPSKHATILLADAYMKIQEPERASKLYQQALANDASPDIDLMRKLGKAVITTHDYNRVSSIVLHPSLSTGNRIL